MDAVARVAIPLLEYAPITQNSLRSGVPNIRVGSDEGSRAYSLEIADDRDNFDTVVEAGYRQIFFHAFKTCLLYTSPSPRDRQKSRMPSSA